jgi:hypothetical protein
MAIGVEPLARDRVRKCLSGLPLLKDKEKKMLKIEHDLAKEAVRELDRLRSWFYAFDEHDVETYEYYMNRSHYRFKSSVLCAVIAHSRNINHFAGKDLEWQSKFLEANRHVWEILKDRMLEREWITERAKKQGAYEARQNDSKSED